MNKKTIFSFVLISLFCLGITNAIWAQKEETKTEEAKTEKDNDHVGKGYEGHKVYFDLGIGFSRYRWGVLGIYNYNNNDHYHRFPALRTSFEYGFTDFLSGGAFFGYTNYGWSDVDVYNGVEYKVKELYQYYAFGARATFHVWAFLNNTLDLDIGAYNLDLYVSAMIGGRIEYYTDKDVTEKNTYNDFDFYIGPMVGAKYYFTKNISVFIETGYGSISYAMLGVGFKF